MPNTNTDIKLQYHITLLGWGNTYPHSGASTVLQQASLKVVSQDTCDEFNFKNLGIHITKQMLCAGNGPDDRRSGCQGDSGGPFVCSGPGGRYTLQGAVSWGSGRCDAREGYSVFVRITEYLDWISQNTR